MCFLHLTDSDAKRGRSRALAGVSASGSHSSLLRAHQPAGRQSSRCSLRVAHAVLCLTFYSQPGFPRLCGPALQQHQLCLLGTAMGPNHGRGSKNACEPRAAYQIDFCCFSVRAETLKGTYAMGSESLRMPERGTPIPFPAHPLHTPRFTLAQPQPAVSRCSLLV